MPKPCRRENAYGLIAFERRADRFCSKRHEFYDIGEDGEEHRIAVSDRTEYIIQEIQISERVGEMVKNITCCNHKKVVDNV